MSGYGYEPKIRTLVAVKITGYADTNPLRSIGSYPLRLGDGSLSSHPQTTGYADRLVSISRTAIHAVWHRTVSPHKPLSVLPFTTMQVSLCGGLCGHL